MTKQELQAKIEAKRARVREVLGETKGDGDTAVYDFAKAKADWLGDEIVKMTDADQKTARVVEAIQNETAELNDLQDQYNALVKAEKALDDFRDADDKPAKRPAHAEPEGKDRKTLGQLVVENPRFKAWLAGSERDQRITLDVPAKTLFETGAGWAPESIREPGFVPIVTRPIQLLDILPLGRTGQAAVKYMEETTFTPGAEGVAEGAQKPEAVFALTERTVDVKEVADSIPVTEVQLEDVAQVESYLMDRLRFGVRQKLDGHAIDNGGDTDSISGVLNSISIQNQAIGADDLQDAIFKAMTLVRVNGRAMPTHVVMNSFDWQDIRLTRDAVNGGYLWGPPSEAGPSRIWGLPVVINDVLPTVTGQDGKVLVGSFENAWISLVERRGIVVEMGWVNDQFRENRRTIRASGRWALVLRRPVAFATVTIPEVT